jgi:hypothetical protein
MPDKQDLHSDPEFHQTEVNDFAHGTSDKGLSPQAHLEFRIVTDESQNPDRFWLALTKSGTCNPSQLMHQSRLEDIFDIIDSAGVQSSEPLLLTDSIQDPPRYLFLLAPPQREGDSVKEWVEGICDGLAPWPIQNLGLYFSPDIISKDLKQEILRVLIPRLQESFAIRTLYCLIGRSDFSELLNDAVVLKEDLRLQGTDLFIFH